MSSRPSPFTVPGWTLAAATLSAGLTLFLPATVLLTNAREFSTTAGAWVIVGLGLWAALAAGLVLAGWLLRRWSASAFQRGLALMCALSLLVWVQGNFLVWGYGPFDGRDIPWPSMVWYGVFDAGIWLAVLGATLVWPRAVARASTAIALALIAAQSLHCAVLVARQPEQPSFKQFVIDDRHKFEFSAQQNVVILVLDSFPTDVFIEALRRTPGLAEPFAGFTHFRNTVGAFPYTELSVAAMLTGEFYDNSAPFEAWKRRVFMAGSVPRVLKSAGWRVDLFPKVSYSLYFSEEVASNFVRETPVRERWRDLGVLYDVALFKGVPHFARRLIYGDGRWFVRRLTDGGPPRLPDAEPRVRERTGGPGSSAPSSVPFPAEAMASRDVRFVADLLSRASVGPTGRALKFYHWDVPHKPLLLDEQFGFRRLEVNRSNYLSYATAGLKLAGLFLDRLRSLGVYENSLIVIAGDHGAGFQPVPFVLQPGMRVAAGEAPVTAPLRATALSLMLVKPFGAAGPLRVSDAPVSLADVPATVFASLGMPQRSAGVSMLALGDTDRRERRFYNYSDGDHYGYYGDMVEYVVEGRGWLDASWRRSGRILTSGGSRQDRRSALGQDLLFSDTRDPDVLSEGFHHVERAGTTRYHWTNGAAAITAPIAPGPKPTTLSLEVWLASRPNLRLRVLVDECEVLSAEMPGGRWSQDLPLGACAPSGRWTTIRFLSDTVRPGGSDRRPLGVALTRVILR